MNRNIIFFLFVFISFTVCAQGTLGMKEVYLENDLVYKYSDNERFTGIAQIKKRNGQVIYEEVYKDGVILVDYQYYKGPEKDICYKTEYNRYKLWVKQKEYYYPKSKDRYEVTSFDENGTKILIEQFENEELIYSCQYSGKKKHGEEMCYDDKGDKLIFQYVNGRKVKN